ncbi:hypothetical protein MMC07_009646 [Pseudocyphellaria aurata]|nr:hypothetical protein [Pseudocyphellaria aurata]
MSGLQERQENAGATSLIVAPQPSPLGDFSKLPLEVRWNIWEYLGPAESDLPKDTASRGKLRSSRRSRKNKKANRMAILRTSRHMYAEIAPILYDRDLCVRVSANQNKWTIKGLPRAIRRDFRHTDFSRFRKIEFEFEAPEPDTNPLGDVTLRRLRDQTYDIVSCIEKYQQRVNFLSSPWRPFLPQIGIFFVNTDTATWFSDKEARQALYESSNCSDVGYILSPFLEIRRVAVVEMDLSLSLYDRDEKWIQLIIESMAEGIAELQGTHGIDAQQTTGQGQWYWSTTEDE